MIGKQVGDIPEKDLPLAYQYLLTQVSRLLSSHRFSHIAQSKLKPIFYLQCSVLAYLGSGDGVATEVCQSSKHWPHRVHACSWWGYHYGNGILEDNALY